MGIVMKKTLLFIICALNVTCFSFGMELETRKRKSSDPLPLSKRPRQTTEDFCGTQSKESSVTPKDKKNRASDLYICLISEDPDYAQKEAAAIVEIAN